MLERGGKGLLHRVLGEFHVAEGAGQDREGAPPLLPEEFLQPDYEPPSSSKTITGRTSTEPCREPGILAAHSSASSIEPTSTM